MSKIHIEWGNLGRSEAIERDIQQKSEKIFTVAHDATKLVVHFQVTNPASSAGVSQQKVSLELRLPNNQDVRAENEGKDLYKCIRDSKKALLAQVISRKNIKHDRAVDRLEEADDIIDEDHSS